MSDDPLLADAARRLARDYGLDLAAIGPTVLGAALADLPRAGATAASALDTPASIATLFNALPVGLSWIDRDAAQLRSAAAWAAARQQPLRILSAPCARGEEVWSLAAALLDAGVAPSAVQILGVDAMPAAIAAAERGEYSAAALPGRTDAPLPWWLTGPEGRWQVHPRLRPLVRFRVANLLDPGVLAESAPFDLILTRNFLIYLTPEARLRWCARLAELLHPQGRLYCAASEPLPSWTTAFAALSGEVPGACVHAAARVASWEQASAATPVERPPPAPRTVTSIRRVEARAAPVAEVSQPGRDPRALADAGALQAAEALLVERLARPVPAAEDLVTAALIALARGRSTDAEDALRRALFLDHRQAEAATLLATLLDQRGEADEASRLRTRAGGRR